MLVAYSKGPRVSFDWVLSSSDIKQQNKFMMLAMSTAEIKIVTDIPESDQIDSFQNATLHQAGCEFACSISITPDYPTNLKTQGDIAAHLKSHLQHLANLGWQFEIQIGLDCDSEEQ